jgi:hypothetical protein
MKKAWAWIKKNWKYLIFPLWIGSVILVWVFRGGEKPLLPISGTTDEAADEAMKAKEAAVEKFRARLDEIHTKAAERLANASEEQVKEFEEIKDKPLEEVAAWIDNLS